MTSTPPPIRFGGPSAGGAERGCALKLERIQQKFGDFVAVSNVDIEIAAGEMVALLGPSGCGKSTLLRIISGFTAQSGGRVLFDGRPVDHLGPAQREIGIVFQNYALFPHMTVRENVAYGLECRRWPRARITPRVDEMLEVVHMREFAERLPRQLSGGQQQRIALARCLAVDPKVLLLDEPFGALDKNLRLDMQIEIKRLQREYGITTVLVTHDQEEALSMADRIAVMSKGRIEQIATPTEIYDRPGTLFVSQFVGTTNLMIGTIASIDESGCLVRLANGAVLRSAEQPAMTPGTQVRVAVRPEQFSLHPTPGEGRVAGRITAVMPLGAQVVYEVDGDGGALKVAQPRGPQHPALAAGSPVFVAPTSASACRLFPI